MLPLSPLPPYAAHPSVSLGPHTLCIAHDSLEVKKCEKKMCEKCTKTDKQVALLGFTRQYLFWFSGWGYNNRSTCGGGGGRGDHRILSLLVLALKTSRQSHCWERRGVKSEHPQALADLPCIQLQMHSFELDSPKSVTHWKFILLHTSMHSLINQRADANTSACCYVSQLNGALLFPLCPLTSQHWSALAQTDYVFFLSEIIAAFNEVFFLKRHVTRITLKRLWHEITCHPLPSTSPPPLLHIPSPPLPHLLYWVNTRFHNSSTSGSSTFTSSGTSLSPIRSKWISVQGPQGPVSPNKVCACMCAKTRSTCMWMWVCTCLYACACVHVKSTCGRQNRHACACGCACVCMCVHVCMHMFVCMWMCMCTSDSRHYILPPPPTHPFPRSCPLSQKVRLCLEESYKQTTHIITRKQWFSWSLCTNEEVATKLGTTNMTHFWGLGEACYNWNKHFWGGGNT